jgi:hypothetical protein
VGERPGRQRRVKLPAVLGCAHQFGELVAAFAYVVAHRPGDVLVAACGDECLDDEIPAGVTAAGEPAADAQEQVRDGSAGISGERLREQLPAVPAQRGHEQFRFRAKVRIQRAAAYVGGHGDVSDPRAVVPAPGEDVRRR